jgi:hypothetical protein
MHSKDQRGAVSLLWAAVLAGVVALAAMVALLSVGHEHHYFAGAWKRITGGVGEEFGRAAERTFEPGSSSVRKCTIAGKVVYSNVECDQGNPTTQRVMLQETQGFEAPKLPQAPIVEPDTSISNKAIEKAIGR